MPDTDPVKRAAGRLQRTVVGIVLSVVAVIAVCVAAMSALAPRPVPPAVVKNDRPSMFSRMGKGVDDVALVDSNQRAVKWGDLVGAPRALFFGFTHCPEICPTTIADISGAMERIGPDAARLRVDFVTFDPERDTPAALNAYLDSFGPRFVGYSGARGEIERLGAAFRAAHRRTPVEGGDYTIDHTTTVYLINERGEVVDTIAYQSAPAEVDAKLARLLGH